MSLLSRVSYPPLKADSYQLIITSYEEASTLGKDKVTMYDIVKFTAAILPDGRPISFNKFAAGFDFMVTDLRKQLIDETDTNMYPSTTLFNMAKTTPVTVWISYATVDGKQYRNENFSEPILEDAVSADGQSKSEF